MTHTTRGPVQGHPSDDGNRIPAASFVSGEKPVRWDSAGRPALSRRTRPMTDKLSVLIVEDQEDVAQSTAELLGLCGHTVRISADGPDALRYAASEPPDVVLVDIRLPGMDGWELVRRLRAGACGKQPVVVAVTGCGTEIDRRRSADAGMDAHLVKPVDPVRLIGLMDWIRRCLLL